MSLVATLKAALSMTLADAAAISAGGQRGITIAETETLSFADGTGTGQADVPWSSEGRTISSGNNEDIDVYDFGSIDIGGGAGLGLFGEAIALAEICALLIVNRSTSAGSLIVGGNGTAAAWNSLFGADDDAAITLPPNGIILLATANDPAWAVADSANHLLRFAASGGDVTYDAYLLGRSA